MLVYIARHGVTTTDLFRRPGNSSELKGIMKRMVEGKEVVLTDYNFYTLASVIKVAHVSQDRLALEKSSNAQCNMYCCFVFVFFK